VERERLTAAVVIAVLSPVFGHFETKAPLWRRMAQWLGYLAMFGAVGLLVGRPWTWAWIAGLPLTGTTFHVMWSAVVMWCGAEGRSPALLGQPR
jgi:hypothetical protein